MNISMNGFSLKRDQRGMVSILVTMVIMLVISLIVIGFATLSRREQRQALDRQLSTQAFYAAEAGINDAIEALRDNISLEKSSCEGQLPNGNNVLDAENGVSYTCLLIDPSPSSLEYASIDTDQATVVPLIPASGSLQRINISWQDKSGGSNFAGCPTPAGGGYVFPAASQWPSSCNAGVLRIDLVPRDTTLSRAGLMSRSLAAFLYPQNAGTSPSVYTYNLTAPDRGATIPANCNANSSASRKCSVNIDLVGTTGVGGYYLRVRSVYLNSNVNVTGFAASNTPVDLISAQAVVDSTGKANDVLRRISVRVPLTNLGSNVPGFAIQTSDSLCKRFAIGPTVEGSPRTNTGDPGCAID